MIKLKPLTVDEAFDIMLSLKDYPTLMRDWSIKLVRCARKGK